MRFELLATLVGTFLYIIKASLGDSGWGDRPAICHTITHNDCFPNPYRATVNGVVKYYSNRCELHEEFCIRPRGSGKLFF